MFHHTSPIKCRQKNNFQLLFGKKTCGFTRSSFTELDSNYLPLLPKSAKSNWKKCKSLNALNKLLRTLKSLE